MVDYKSALQIFVLAAVLGLSQEQVITRRDPDGLRYQYIRGPDDVPLLHDTWLTLEDYQKLVRYNPDQDNEYHLFTRSNPTVSQPLLMGVPGILMQTNFDPRKKTALLVHGWIGSATADSNLVLIPAYIASDDINVIVVDWSVGAHTSDNALASARAIARFVVWLNEVTGAALSDYHIVGYSLGGQVAAMVGRNLGGEAGFLMALDPAAGWEDSEDNVTPEDGVYTEVIHTSIIGSLKPLGDVDFYPNGGREMPGCDNLGCHHARAYFYIAESLRTGGFTGIECLTYEHALVGDCDLPGTLKMGGLQPKTGSTGIYYLETHAAPPFSMDE